MAAYQMIAHPRPQPSAKPRVKFQGIVEARGRAPAAGDDDYGLAPIARNERQWNAMSGQVWQVSRLTAIFVFFAFVVGMPLGNYFAHLKIYGSASGWNPLDAYDFIF